MEACEVVRLFVNKAIVPAEPKRRGNPGYGRVKAIRVLVYARLKRLGNDTRIAEYLKKHMDVSRTLGLCRAPDRTTVGRWWKRYIINWDISMRVMFWFIKSHLEAAYLLQSSKTVTFLLYIATDDDSRTVKDLIPMLNQIRIDPP